MGKTTAKHERTNMKEQRHFSRQASSARRTRAWAGEESDMGGFQPLLRQSGTLESIDVSAGWLELKHGGQQPPEVFLWNRQTQYQEKGKPIAPGDLKPGERINILYTKEGSHLLAKTILVRSRHDTIPKHQVPKHNPC